MTDAPAAASPPRGARRSARDGVVAALPFIAVGGPFALVFGAVATEAGLDLLEVMAVTSIVVAGASQFAMVELMADGAPAFVALIASLAVNLRLAMYSASLSRHLGGAPLKVRAVMAFFLIDQTYALSMRRHAERPEDPLDARVAYYFGVGVPMFAAWYLFTYIGAVAGSRIPPEWSLDFAPAVTFLALIAPMLRGAPNLVAAFVAVTGSLLLAFLPWSLGLLAGAALGMAAGAWTEAALARRRGAA